MKKQLLLLLIILLPAATNSQVITGTILDKKDKSPVISSSVYFDGTSVGALTDDKGNFRLDISRHPTMPLSISAIGYFSVTLTDYKKDKPNVIYLEPKTFELNEIVVREKGHWLRRSENLTFFRNEFLGKNGNAVNCTILNEDDIRFKNSRDNDTVKAYAVKPILIDNKALGYRITYFLDKFVYVKSNETFMFEGKVFFTEDSLAKGSKRDYYEKKRKAAYQGSRMHFIRSLWINELNAAGFSVRNSANESLNYKRIVVERENNRKYLRYNGSVGVAFYTKIPMSNIVFRKEYVYFDAFGYYEPDGLMWEGEMAKPRLADMLPYEYQVN
jgi:hypothetical protein